MKSETYVKKLPCSRVSLNTLEMGTRGAEVGVRKNYKEGTITIKTGPCNSDAVRLTKNGSLIEFYQRDNYVFATSAGCAHLWPILKLYAETERIFEDRYQVERHSDGNSFFVCRSSTTRVSDFYKTKAAAQLVCDAMNEAARMEE